MEYTGNTTHSRHTRSTPPKHMSSLLAILSHRLDIMLAWSGEPDAKRRSAQLTLIPQRNLAIYHWQRYQKKSGYMHRK